MSTTPAPELVSPLSEPERHLHQRLRNRSRVVSETIENEAFADITTEENMATPNNPENEPNMNQYSKPTLEGYGSGVAQPEITVNFEIKSSIIHMVENSVQFHGLLDEDPLSHISRFLRICGTFKIEKCSEDQIKHKLFPFSLRSPALDWLESLPSGTITNWEQIVEKFLLKYFPPDKTAKYRASITGFRTDEDESLHAAWKRYKSLLRRCPHHSLNKWLQVQTFFDAQSSQNKQAIDQIAGGDLGTKSPNEAFEVLEKAANKSFAYNPPRSTPSHKGIHQVGSNTLVTAQIEAFSKKFEQLQTELVKAKNKCDTCGLPSNTVNNPNAAVNAVTLRSGRTTMVTEPTSEPVATEKETEIPKKVQERLVPASTARPKEPVRTYIPPIPYPTRLKKERLEAQYEKFLELFKQLHINIPFVEALSQMPKYAKYLKYVLTNKRKLEELSHVTLNKECSAILQNKLPEKMTDPGSFTIPYLIGRIGEPKPTRMSIQLADRSIKYPRVIVENMLVKIDKFVFPVDFVILDMEEDKNVPLILRRPFLATARALIDVCTGKLTLRVNDEQVTFDIGRSMQHPQHHDDSLYCINVIDSVVSCHVSNSAISNALDTQILEKPISEPIREDHIVEEVIKLEDQ
ncbi:uncharacterized protein LOC143636341 [Bidens hawaiensis]|uniref:uncharacterized protein LOC143636341 n=1 Tax=Bidens hawaiensis TaxID=980011 RepID=UPI00404B76A5